MTYGDWINSQIGETGLTLQRLEELRTCWDAGTAAERKRILGLMNKFIFTVGGSVTVRYRKLIQAIEHPEPDAGETKS